MFSGKRFHLLPSGIGKARLDLFRRRIEAKGGTTCVDFKQFLDDIGTSEGDDQPICHFVVAEDSMTFEKVTKILKLKSPPEVKMWFVTTKWLSDCLKEDACKKPVDYALLGSALPAHGLPQNVPSSSGSALRPEHQSSSSASLDEGVTSAKIQKLSDTTLSEIADSEIHEKGNSGDSYDRTVPLPPGNWVCTQIPSKSDKDNGNSFVISQLEQLCQVYKTTKDQWRQLSYRKAISALKNSPEEVKTYEDAIALPGVGASIAEKIVEIVKSGKLRKLESLGNDDKIQCMDLFQKVWGVGPTYAETFFNLGYRTLDDLRSKADLTRQHQIGLKHFDDLSLRMSWAEADRIRSFVESVALQIKPGLFVEGCGSYRRERETCGDIDILITHPDGNSQKEFMASVGAIRFKI